MAKIVPLLNGQEAPVSGSFVIAPYSEAGLQIENIQFLFTFVDDEHKEGFSLNSVVFRDHTEFTFVNTPTTHPVAFDIEGLKVDGRNVWLSLVVQSFGSGQTHRLVNYTLSVPSEEGVTNATLYAESTRAEDLR